MMMWMVKAREKRDKRDGTSVKQRGKRSLLDAVPQANRKITVGINMKLQYSYRRHTSFDGRTRSC